jgi:hypothetical protein
LNAGQQLIPNESNALEPPTSDMGSSDFPDTADEFLTCIHQVICPMSVVMVEFEGRKGNTKMEQTSPTWNQPQSITTTCKLSQPSVEIGHRVSFPQFHIQFDDFFETVRPSAGNEHIFCNGSSFQDLLTDEQRIEDRTLREQQCKMRQGQ